METLKSKKLFIRHWSSGLLLIFSLASFAQSPENLRSDLTRTCIEMTKEVMEMAGSSAKEIEDAKNYCNCLYSSVIKSDLDRLISGELKLPELMNKDYIGQQDSCASIYIEQHSDQGLGLKSLEEKLNFWGSRLCSYYLMTYKQFNSNKLLKMVECIKPFLKTNFEGYLSLWEKQELTSTQVFHDHPEVRKKIESCY